jgi:hypothetical protein
LLGAIFDRSLGWGSIAGGEYLRNMAAARQLDDGTVRWVQVCYCPRPLEEEISYWEEYFELEQIKDAHNREQCRDTNGSEPWACSDCDCTERLEERLDTLGAGFHAELAAGRRE